MYTKSFLTVALVALLSLYASAQGQIETFINEAREFVAQKNYTQAKLSLQDAIAEIDNMVGLQIAEALPDEINGLKSSGSETSSAGMGMIGGGMQITKSYQHPSNEANSAEVQIIANSPMLQAMNLYLTNPGMMGPGYKSVRVGTRRAILRSESEDYYDSRGGSKQIRATEIQVPLNQTLITIQARGFASEQDELAFAAKLDIDKLRTLLGD